MTIETVEAPCLRCGRTLTWKLRREGALAYCAKGAGGCGAKVSLGRGDPFPAPWSVGVGQVPVSDPSLADPPADTPEPPETEEDLPSDGREKLWFE